MAKFYVIDATRTLAEGVTADGVTAANLDKLLRKGRAHFDVSPVHAMVEPVGVEITPAAVSEAMTRPAEAGIRLKAGEVAASRPGVVNSGDTLADKGPAATKVALDEARRRDERNRDEASKAKAAPKASGKKPGKK